jgi:hypothetical protein
MTRGRVVSNRLISACGAAILAILGGVVIRLVAGPQRGNTKVPGMWALFVGLPAVIVVGVALAFLVAARRASAGPWSVA